MQNIMHVYICVCLHVCFLINLCVLSDTDHLWKLQGKKGILGLNLPILFSIFRLSVYKLSHFKPELTW